MEDISKLLPSLPSWIAIPVVLLTIVLSLVPRIYTVFTDLTAHSRQYKRENERLTLLKLRYEIEALKKQTNLPDLSEELIAKPPPQSAPTLGAQPLSAWIRFRYGATGAITAPILGVVIALFTSPEDIERDPIAYMLAVPGLIVVASVGGLASAAILRHRTTRLVCFLLGLSVVFVMQGVVQKLSQRAAARHNTEAPIKPGSHLLAQRNAFRLTGSR